MQFVLWIIELLIDDSLIAEVLEMLKVAGMSKIDLEFLKQNRFFKSGIKLAQKIEKIKKVINKFTPNYWIMRLNQNLKLRKWINKMNKNAQKAILQAMGLNNQQIENFMAQKDAINQGVSDLNSLMLNSKLDRNSQLINLRELKQGYQNDLNQYKTSEDDNRWVPLSSSWLAYGYFKTSRQGAALGTLGLIIVTRPGNVIYGPYYYPDVPLETWRAMKQARGMYGSGAGSVFWRQYLGKNGLNYFRSEYRDYIKTEINRPRSRAFFDKNNKALRTQLSQQINKTLSTQRAKESMLKFNAISRDYLKVKAGKATHYLATKDAIIGSQKYLRERREYILNATENARIGLFYTKQKISYVRGYFGAKIGMFRDMKRSLLSTKKSINVRIGNLRASNKDLRAQKKKLVKIRKVTNNAFNFANSPSKLGKRIVRKKTILKVKRGVIKNAKARV